MGNLGILLLTFFASMILGCICWLIIGEKFPLKAEEKLPPLNNIAMYTMASFLPVYFLIFLIFSVI